MTLLPFIIGAGATICGLWFLLWLATRAIRRSAARLRQAGLFDEGDFWAGRLIAFARRTFYALATLVATMVMLRGVGIRGVPRLSQEQVGAWLVGPGFRLVLIGASAFILTRAIRFLIENLQLLLLSVDIRGVDLPERRKRVNTLGQLFSVLTTLVVSGVAVLMALSLFDIDIRPFLAGAGILGLAVGFGAQTLVRDVIAGFFLIVENQVRVGDVVAINGKSGRVEAVRLRTIVLRGLDGTVHVLPNGGIGDLSNMTKDYSYCVLDVGVAYKEDVERVMEVLREVGAALQRDPVHGPLVLEPLDILGVDAFADSAVVIKMRMKTAPVEQWRIGRELRRRIKRAFDERGIEIPFPHLSVYFGAASRPFEIGSIGGHRRGRDGGAAGGRSGGLTVLSSFGLRSN